jgi:hypothetical protein
MIYDALSQHLSEEVSDFIIGSTLFAHQAPFDKEKCGLFRDNPTGIDIDGYVPTERSGTFQFVIRGKKQAEIHDLMQQAMDALTIYGKTIEGYNIKVCRPTTEPLNYQLSVANLREISVNFSINYGIVR